ncbi:unnamed protein product [Mesocestoides corti]|uniref:Uncharacterized protein n=1 Tax=Mesocestoides corti TaxID=53468 RepID=A0A0R3UP08_MESCO|nr:unnamed protein product [Mesocestoides corti]
MPEGDPEARYRPLLWRVLNKGPIERENMYRGLAPWSTEYNSNYSPKTFGIDTCAFDDTQVGVPESTGYVINKKTEEPFLYQSPPLPMAKTSYTLEFRPYRPRTVDVHTDGGPKTVLPDGFSIGNKADVDFMPLTDKNIPSCFGEKLYGCARELFKRDMPKYWNSYHASAFPGQVRSIERRPDLPDARLGRNCKDLKPCLKDGTNDGSIFKSANAGQRKTCTFAELVNVDSQPRKVTGGVVGLDKFAPKVATAFQPAGVPDYECK